MVAADLTRPPGFTAGRCMNRRPGMKRRAEARPADGDAQS